MISRNKAKFIKSLQLKKFRKQEGAFVVEGAKSVLELVNADFEVLMLVGTSDFLKTHGNKFSGMEVVEASESELASLGEFRTNSGALAVAAIKPNRLLPIETVDYVLVLDDIRDPGNLGTITRIADWYGIKQIVASATTAELYNPKVLHASMGSFVRTNVFYTDLEQFLREHGRLIVYGATLDGKSIHDTAFSTGGAILIGNESNGIGEKLLPLVNEKVSIPRYGKAESLNAAIATAVICDRIRAGK